MNSEMLPLSMANEVLIGLKPYSGNNDYQLNYLYGRSRIPPGRLQYDVSENTILGLDTVSLRLKCIDYSSGWVIDFPTKETALRLISDTTTGRMLKDKLKLLLVIKKTFDDGIISYKGAFRNTETNELVLMSSVNNIGVYSKSKLLNSHDPEYKVCQCKMIAPLMFWDILKNTLINDIKPICENVEDYDNEEEDDEEEETNSVLPTIKRKKQNFWAKYEMVSPTARREIIAKIDTGEIDTKVITGQKAKWWLKNHYPKKDIPTNIYLLGGGLTLKELYQRYNNEYTNFITWRDFRNYTRELVAQGILYKQ